MVYVVSDGHALAETEVVTPGDLDGLPFIHTARTRPIYRDLRVAFEAAGADLNGVVETRQFAPACIMVAEGYDVSIVSEIDAREYESSGLTIRPFEADVTFSINILYPAYLPRSFATIEFVEAFRSAVEPFEAR